jgi:37-kD nucleoid-associated bacterial protein
MGVFIEVDPTLSNRASGDGWEAFLYDEVAVERNKAAQYFYSSFLGLSIPLDSAHQTKSFYDLSKKFINSLDVTDSAKVELNTGLFSYLKVEQTPTIDRSTFASRFLATPELQDAFSKYMDKNNFPTGAITKDISQIASLLRRRNFVFASDVRLSVPADSFESLVKIEPVEGDPSPDGSIPQWTKITVRDRLKSEQ